MNHDMTPGRPAEKPERLALRDLLIVAVAVAGVVLANVGVVRALDVALDALHAAPPPVTVFAARN